ncbi:MAG: ArsR family transcriptional regulator [Candidatus Zixiibacteriota bacterium]
MNTFRPRFISVVEARRRSLAGDGLLIVSVFPEAVHAKSHIEGSISLEALESRLAELPKDAALAFY